MNMTLERRRSAALLIGGGLLVCAILIALLSKVSSTTTASAQVIQGGGNVPSNCAKTLHFAAYDAPAGSHNFGPTQHFASAADAVVRSNDKQCSDALSAAIHTMARLLGKNVQNLDARATRALAAKYVANRALWRHDVDAFNKDVVSMTLVNYNVSYETLGMVPGTNRTIIPGLIKSSQKVPLGQSLDIKLKSGVVLHDRTVCDLQLSVPQFPNVPVKATPPTRNVPSTPATPTKPTTPTTPTSPPKCTLTAPPGQVVTPQCTLSKPPQSFDCMQNPHPGCPPNPAHQPVQVPGQQTVGVPGAPSHAPQPLPTNPTATAGNSGGFNPGPSGAPGGSTAGPGGSSTGNPKPTSSPICDPALGCGGTPTGAPPPPP